MHLAVLDGVQAVYVEKLEPVPAAKIEIIRAGARLPAQCSDVGKILLAHSEWEYVAGPLEDQGMPALTHNSITTLDVLSEELEQVRERGYAYDHEEILIELCCRGAPAYGPGERWSRQSAFGCRLTGLARTRATTPRPFSTRPDAYPRMPASSWKSIPTTRFKCRVSERKRHQALLANSGSRRRVGGGCAYSSASGASIKS